MDRGRSSRYLSFGFAAPARRPSLGRGTADPAPRLLIPRCLALPLLAADPLAFALAAGCFFLLAVSLVAAGLDLTDWRWLSGVLACNFGTACSGPRFMLRARLGDSIFAFAVTSALEVRGSPEPTAAAYNSSYDATRQS